MPQSHKPKQKRACCKLSNGSVCVSVHVLCDCVSSCAALVFVQLLYAYAHYFYPFTDIVNQADWGKNCSFVSALF